MNRAQRKLHRWAWLLLLPLLLWIVVFFAAPDSDLAELAPVNAHTHAPQVDEFLQTQSRLDNNADDPNAAEANQ